MADNQIQMPRSSGGLVRYFDDIKSKLSFSPYLVVGLIILIVILEFILHRYVRF